MMTTKRQGEQQQKFPSTLRMKLNEPEQYQREQDHHHHPQQQLTPERSSSTSNSNNNSCPSFRVYYGGVSVAVPFVWESKPGTPKHPSSLTTENDYSNSLLTPPLTPPPSYYRQSPDNYGSCSPCSEKLIKRRSSSSLFPDFCKKIITIRRGRRNNSKARRSLATVYDLGVHDDDEKEVISSPTSTLCFWR